MHLLSVVNAIPVNYLKLNLYAGLVGWYSQIGCLLPAFENIQTVNKENLDQVM
jgi:hypothetical protein